jgi:hypothetical protein
MYLVFIMFNGWTIFFIIAWWTFRLSVFVLCVRHSADVSAIFRLMEISLCTWHTHDHPYARSHDGSSPVYYKTFCHKQNNRNYFSNGYFCVFLVRQMTLPQTHIYSRYRQVCPRVSFRVQEVLIARKILYYTFYKWTGKFQNDLFGVSSKPV